MADYYVDENGNITKNKKKKNKPASYSVDLDGNITRLDGEPLAVATKTAGDDIGPVKPTVSLTDDDIGPVKATTKDENDDLKWFQRGAFEDGYQFGDVTKTILGSAADMGENIGAGIIGIGEMAVDAMLWAAPYVAQGQFYQNGGAYQPLEIQKAADASFDQAKKGNAEIIKKDLYDEEAVAKKLLSVSATRQALNGLGVEAEDASVFGEKTDSLAQSGGQLLATAGLQAVGVPWFVTSGVISFGSEAENALNQGATMEEAGLSAAITAGAEILTEKISGGIKFDGGTLDDALTKRIARGVSSKVVRTLSKLGLDMVGEGAEEVLSGTMSAIGQKITYADDTELSELFSFEDALEAFIGGAVLGNVGGSVQAIKSGMDGVDYTSGLTDNEQAVVAKVYKDAVAEAEKNGKVTERQKSKIYIKVLEQMENGDISTDTIEEILGGETYKSYKEAVDSEDALTKEYEALGDLVESQMTAKQKKRFNELDQQITEMKKTDTRSQLKSKLSEEVSGLVQGSRLYESYNQKAMRGQAFEADLTKYDAAQQETVRRAVESGVLNNTRKTHAFVDFIAKITADKGVPFDFTNNTKLKESGFALNGKTVNGFVKDGTITLNAQSAKYLNSVVGHEVTHVLEGTDLYKTLQDAVFEYAKTKGEYQARYDALAELYKDIEDADIDAELTADLIGDYLFTDSDFVNNLSTNHRNVFQKIYDEIKYLCRVATAGSKEARQLEKVKKTFEKAYRAEGTKNPTSEGGVRYSLNKNAKTELHKALYDKNYQGEVLLRDESPPIMVAQKGVKNLPMSMKASHIRENVFTEDEAKKVGLRVANGINYHGLGEDFFLQVIDSLDNVKEAYRGTKNADNAARRENYFLLVSEFTDKDGNTINVPVYVDEHALYNRVFIDVNKVSTVFGRTNFRDYINRQIRLNNLVRIKNRSSQTSESNAPIARDYGKDASTNSIRNPDRIVNSKNSLSLDDDIPIRSDLPTQYGNYTVSGKDITLGDDTPIRDDLPAGGKSNNDTGLDDDIPIRDDIPSAGGTKGSQSVSDHIGLGDDIPIRDDLPAGGKNNNDAGLDDIPIRDDVDTVRPAENTQAQQNATAESRAKAERIVGDKNSVVSKRAEELYQEITSLKKGVRASNALGYLLDYGHDWRSIKTALLNIRDNPDQTVNPNSAAEAVAREMLNSEYEDQVYEWEQLQTIAPAPAEIRTVKDRNQAKLHNYVTELNRNMEMRDDVTATYNEIIAQLQAKYDAKKNKTTVAANNLFQQIEQAKWLRDNAAADYEKRISDLTSRVRKMISKEFKTAEQRQFKQEEYADWAENLVGDTSTWVDKKTGWGYMTNTLRRNLRAIVKDADGNPDYKKADAIYEELQGNYNRHEAEMNRELTKLREKYADLNITKAEDAYIQMLGEYRSNPGTTLTEDVVNEYYEKHKKHIDTKKVDQIIEMARQDYDVLIQRVNEVLRAQGMKEIPYRQGYFPHFTQDKQSWLAKLLNWKTQNDDIPTDIAGLTEQFEPVRSYQSFNKQRTTDITDYSFTKGFDAYSFGAMDWIHHIEDIQKRRALENYIRYVHSDEGVKQKVAQIRANESYDADEAQEQIDLVYKEARNPLNNFVIDLRRGTQTLAGKKSSLDREMEYNTNRKVYSTMTNISNRVSANMVAGSVSAALPNLIPITQSWGTVNPLRSIQAMAQTMKSAIRDDGMVDKSAFLTNRLRKAENLNKTDWDKVSDKISILMNAVDSFTSQVVWRSKYETNMDQGMSENEAILDADNFAEGVLAGRSRGNMPTVFDSKNPIVKTLTAFQLEVANQYGYLFQDMPQDTKNKNVARLVGKYAEVFVGAYVYNALFSSLTGRTAAFDPIRIIEELLKDMGIDDDEEDEDSLAVSEVLGNLSENILQEVPFVGGLLGGGRVPISSALPYDSLTETFSGTIKDIENQDWENLTKEWLNPLLYVVSPMAGGQLKKTIEGASLFLGDKPMTGSYTSSGALRFPVEPTAGNVLQAGLFGRWSGENARDYLDNSRQPLNGEQISEYIDSGLDIQDYWSYRDAVKGLTKKEEKLDAINGLDLPVETKNLLAYNIIADGEPVDMANYSNYSGYDEFMLARENPGKHLVSKMVSDDYAAFCQYQSDLNGIHADKNANGDSIAGSAKQKKTAYINGLDIEYGAKLILFKSEYPSDDTYNYEIVDYLNSRNDISYEEMETILKELGFTVLTDGTVRWD